MLHFFIPFVPNTSFRYPLKTSENLSLIKCIKFKRTDPATGGVLKNIFWKFFKFQRKTPVLESLFNKVAGLKARHTKKVKPKTKR